MPFLNPVALWLLLVVPVVFLVRRRPKRRRVPVANLYLWSAARPSGTSALTRRFRRHRLFLLQALVLVAIVFALARPLFTMGTRSAVIVDASLSMSARDGSVTRLDEAKRRAAAFLDDLPWNARVHVIAATASPRDLGEFRVSDPVLRRTLAAIAPSVESGDLAAAIQLARSLETSPDHIEVFSDLSAPVSSRLSSDIGWSVIGAPADNVAITGLGVLRGRQTAHASVSIASFARTAVSRTVVLEQGDRAVARERVEVGPGRTYTLNAEVGLTDVPLTARIDEDDALPQDNQRQAVVPPVRRARVLLSGAGFFLEQALRVHPGVDLTVGPSSGVYDVIVCAQCSELPAGSASVLFIPPPGDSRSPAPMTLNAVEHPLVDGLGLADLSVASVAVAREVKRGTVIATAGDLPAIVADAGARRVVEWRFDVSDSALTLSSAFPLLVANAIEWLTVEQTPSTRVAGDAGQRLVNPDTTNESDLRAARVAIVPAAVTEPRAADRGARTRNEITALLLLLATGALVIEWRLRRNVVSQV